jgi:hypothetical protein
MSALISERQNRVYSIVPVSKYAEYLRHSAKIRMRCKTVCLDHGMFRSLPPPPPQPLKKAHTYKGQYSGIWRPVCRRWRYYLTPDA